MRRSPWVVAAAALACGVAAIALLGVDRELLRALVATYVGAAIGFFVALYVDRLQRAEEEVTRRKLDSDTEERARTRDVEVARRHRVTVLKLLREELGRVPAQMGNRQDRHERRPPFDRLTDLLWKTLSATGELHWIDDLDLLKKIASAYDLLAVEIYLERMWLESRANTGLETTPAHSFFANQLKVFDHDTWTHVCEACKAIDAALERDGEHAPEGQLFCP